MAEVYRTVISLIYNSKQVEIATVADSIDEAWKDLFEIGCSLHGFSSSSYQARQIRVKKDSIDIVSPNELKVIKGSWEVVGSFRGKAHSWSKLV